MRKAVLSGFVIVALSLGCTVAQAGVIKVGAKMVKPVGKKLFANGAKGTGAYVPRLVTGPVKVSEKVVKVAAKVVY